MRIALTGNPNSGKTTMYNALTGRNEKVGNWAGVTVDKKEHPIKKKYIGSAGEIIAVDLPGAYSMSPFTSEESITSTYVKNEHPDAIINIVDSTNLSRSLFFTTQLLELGIPVVVALNKTDVNTKKENSIDAASLSEKLGCPVVETTSTTGEGLKKVVAEAVAVIGKGQKAPYTQKDIDLTDKAAVAEEDRRRFDFVNKIVKSVEVRRVLTKDKNFQDKIDAILTNKWLGIPIFALVMFLVFWISQVGPGVWLAEGYVFEKTDTITVDYNGSSFDVVKEDDPDTEADDEGVVGTWVYEGITLQFAEIAEDAESGVVTLIDGDKTITGEYTFEEDELAVTLDSSELATTFNTNDVEIPGLVTLIEMFGELVSGWLSGTAPILQTIIVDGIIGGVGAVVGFLPLVMVMYFLLALLEDCGYMARVSVVLDPIFKRVGLSGKSVIPLVVGTGCAIPGVMACRTIRNERERIATAMLTPFIPCGAKIPVISLLAGLFFPGSWWVAPLMYFLGLALVFFGALLVKWMSGHTFKKSFFIIELPEYKVPSFKRAAQSMLQRGWSYIVKAGTIILVCNAVVTIMLNYSWTFTEAAPEESILHSIATPIAFLLIPLGFGMWQLAAAAVTGFIAKEEVVGTLGAIFTAIAIDEEFNLLQQGGGEEILGISAVAGLSYLIFNLFSPPCFAAIGAMNSEIKSKKWLFAGIGLQISVAYVSSFFVYQLGTLFTEGKLGQGFVGGLIAVILIIAAVVVLGILSNRKAKREMEEKKKAKVAK